MKKITVLLGIFLVITITNCESLRSVVQEPVVSFKSVELDGISVTGMDIVAYIEVENRNRFTIPLPKIDWELFINESLFLRGVVNNEGAMLNRGTETISLPLSITYEGLFNSFASMIETKEAAYQVALGISFSIPIIENKVYQVDFAGVIPLPQLPKLSFEAPRIAPRGLTGVDLVFDIKVENPNKFSIPFPKLNWNFEVGGEPLVRNSFTGTQTIAAETTGAAAINVSVAYADIIRSVIGLRNNEAPFRLNVDMESPIPSLSSLSNALVIPGTLPILR